MIKSWSASAIRHTTNRNSSIWGGRMPAKARRRDSRLGSNRVETSRYIETPGNSPSHSFKKKAGKVGEENPKFPRKMAGRDQNQKARVQARGTFPGTRPVVATLLFLIHAPSVAVASEKSVYEDGKSVCNFGGVSGQVFGNG